MALVSFVGDGLWVPTLPRGFVGATNVIGSSDSLTLDADEEEAQWIGAVTIDGGGSKTFGTSSTIGWIAGSSITFAAGSTLRVGVKKASSVDTGNGPPARATIGAAAFDVYKDLVGGTDTITSSTWRTDAMASGTPFTVTNGDLIAICFHLATNSGTPSVKVRGGSSAVAGLPATTLVTSGPTYTATQVFPNAVLAFDDGTLGWIHLTYPSTTFDSASATIGSTNIFGNIIRFPFPCQIDALAGVASPATNAANFALDLYSDPLGTPVLMESLAFDANAFFQTSTVLATRPFTIPHTLTADTDYAIGVRQTTATAVTTHRRDVDNANHFKAYGLGAESYAANSTAGAAFVAQNSGKRRYLIWARICAFDDGQQEAGVGVVGSRIFTGY